MFVKAGVGIVRADEVQTDRVRTAKVQTETGVRTNRVQTGRVHSDRVQTTRFRSDRGPDKKLGRSLLRLPPGGRTPPFIVFYDFYSFFY